MHHGKRTLLLPRCFCPVDVNVVLVVDNLCSDFVPVVTTPLTGMVAVVTTNSLPKYRRVLPHCKLFNKCRTELNSQ